jgi:hypothetical protein
MCPVYYKKDQQTGATEEGLKPSAPHRLGSNPAACGGLKPFSVILRPKST